MLKLLCIGILSALTLTACEQQKQASAEVSAIPKTILDKANNDINAAQALDAEKTKALQNIEAPADEAK
jgi:hypothetical protein